MSRRCSPRPVLALAAMPMAELQPESGEGSVASVAAQLARRSTDSADNGLHLETRAKSVSFARCRVVPVRAGAPRRIVPGMKGIRYYVRNFTAVAVMEHLRSQIEREGGRGELTRTRSSLCASPLTASSS